MLTPLNTSKRREVGRTFEATCSNSIYKDTRNRFRWKRPEGVCRTPLFPPHDAVFRSIFPFSRRAKPISSKFYRLPAARRRFSSDFIAFPPQKTVFLRIYPISRRGKAFSESFDRFRAAGSRFAKSEIGLAFHFGVPKKHSPPHVSSM